MKNTFIHLKTNKTSYVLFIDEFSHLQNLHYGSRLSDNEDLNILINKQKNPMGTSTVYSGKTEDVYSLNYLNLEIATIGKGDYRKPSILFEHEKGFASDFVVETHGYLEKEQLLASPLPIPHGFDAYYYVDMIDLISGAKIRLDYLMFESQNVIARRVVVLEGDVNITKLASMNLDLDNAHFDIYSTYGTWSNEWHPSRHKSVPGVFEIATNAGPSSNRHNPFILLLNEETGLDHGFGYGFNLIYSGPFSVSVEHTFDNKLRIQHGLNDESFSVNMKGREPFFTPFAIMTYSDEGENGISHNFHSFVQDNVVRDVFAKKARPILLNNWEGTYFDFTASKIEKMMNEASELGIELFVLDDGWFINRDNDLTGLGHYEVNYKKLPKGLSGLADHASKKDLQFGLWFEPEMVSNDHDIFKNKPHWIVQIPGVNPSTGRFQYSLNLALEEVQEYIIQNVSKILESTAISYVKWDYNRNLSDFYAVNGAFSTFFYDYTVGLYKILKALTQKFPHVLWEGCASGGNRFDLGVLHYFDQIWVSDCSDAYERIRMHMTLAKAYPLSVMSGHVSAVPNHQLLRSIPLQTRFNNAFMSGGFGYELDITNLEMKERREIKDFNGIAKLFQLAVINGTYYELSSTSQKEKKAFGVVSPDKESALVLISNGISSPMPEVSKLPRIKLDEEAIYEVFTLKQASDIKVFGSLLTRVLPKFIKYDGAIIRFLSKRKSAEELINTEIVEKYVVSGKALAQGALTLYPDWTGTGIGDTTRLSRDFTSFLYFIKKKGS